MARIRSIKPEFPQSESMGRVSRDARLLFVELWTICDDSGRTRAASRMLASLLFPYDDDAPSLMDGWLAELEREGCIVRYVADGSTYIQVCKWLSHQKIDKPSPSKIPEFAESSRIVANTRERSSEDQGEEGRGEEGKGDSSIELSSPADAGQVKCPQKEIVAAYHRLLPELPPVNVWTDQNSEALRVRWRSSSEHQTLEWWEGFFAYVRKCPFLMGKKNDFQASLGWLVKAANFAKVLNGQYEQRGNA